MGLEPDAMNNEIGGSDAAPEAREAGVPSLQTAPAAKAAGGFLGSGG